ncbi:hypothetical protein FACS1894184_06010 [Clostridia bacterium]|nr:hypothetical protein FACS1894184_06010 [Clostridia bacterium]
MAGITLIARMTLSRNIDLLNDNGRFSTYINGIEQITSGISRFLFGSGLSSLNYNYMVPHNFVLELWMKAGIIVTVMFIILLYYVYRKTSDPSYKLLFVTSLLGAMLITNISGDFFLTVYAIIGVISYKNNHQYRVKDVVAQYESFI